MERLELQIERARSESLNKDYSTTVGIPQEDFESFANEAQDRLFSEIVKAHPRIFHSEKIYTVTSGQEAYDLPADCHEGKVHLVEFSTDGRGENYYELGQAKMHERSSAPAANPMFYIMRAKQILLVPPATTGYLRVTYVKKPKRLALRRSTVSARTCTSPTRTGMTVAAADLAALDPGSEVAKYNYLSVVDRDGDQMMAGVEFDSINTGTGVVTITGSSFTAQTGETITVGDYVVIGKDACNKSQLPDSCERFLIKWMAACALERDGSTLEARKRELCQEMLSDISSSLADSDHDVTGVTILTTDFMDFGDNLT